MLTVYSLDAGASQNADAICTLGCKITKQGSLLLDTVN